MSHPRQISRETSTRNKIAELGSGTGQHYLSTGAFGEPDDAQPSRIRQPVGYRPRLLFTRLLGRELRSDPFVSPTARAKFRA